MYFDSVACYNSVFIAGIPAPQGSKVIAKKGDKAWLREANTKTRPWRDQIVSELKERHFNPIPSGAIDTELTFIMPRPKSHYRTGKHAGELKDWAPHYCTKKPDVDKLTRAVYDALTISGVIGDDAQIAKEAHEKLYADPDQPTGVNVCWRRICDNDD